MSAGEAAQAIFPSMAKALQKFLKVTRQQPRHTLAAILDHLTVSLRYGLSPKAFLEPYLTARPVYQSEMERTTSIQAWSLVSDVLVTRSIEEGMSFMLRQGEVSLLCTIYRVPHFLITEEIIDPKANKFVFKLNSETSV